jgi:LAGLIDADG endonuclease
MKIIKEFLGCGYVYSQSNQEAVYLKVENFSDVNDKVIPFFTKYSILGVKSLDFYDFTKVADLIKDKNHLNQTGLDKIRIIKAGMNRGRSIE